VFFSLVSLYRTDLTDYSLLGVLNVWQLLYDPRVAD